MSLNESQKARVDTVKLIVEILLAELKGSAEQRDHIWRYHLQMIAGTLQDAVDQDDSW